MDLKIKQIPEYYERASTIKRKKIMNENFRIYVHKCHKVISLHQGLHKDKLTAVANFDRKKLTFRVFVFRHFSPTKT